MTNLELVSKCKDIALNYKTVYILGCIGAPMTAANKKRYTGNYAYNAKPARAAKINAATSDTFGFDCVCLIKSILWGWKGDKKLTYGGAKYASNGVPDIGADAMISKCSGVSTDFSKIEVGEAVWLSGHIGVYIGDGLAVECSPAWKDGVQITGVANIAESRAYHNRTWTKHGKLPWITYEAPKPEPKPEPVKKKTVTQLANEVIAGKWGSGEDRKKRLKAAGYDPIKVQAKVNAILNTKKNIDAVAREVIAGKWGKGAARRSKLIAAGYDADKVQKRVNEILGVK